MATVSEFIWTYLADIGVKHCFFLPGGGSMHLVDALVRQTRIIPVCMLHEQAAGIAADAYAQYTGGLGVCLVTSGPGGTNAVTPCAASWIDSTPVLFISGQCATHQMMKPGQRQGGPQEVDIVSIVRPITKFARNVGKKYKDDIFGVGRYDIKILLPCMVDVALTNPSGPVWLDVPLDIQAVEI